VHRLDHRVGAEVVDHPALDPARHERLDHGDQLSPVELGDHPRAHLEGSRSAWVVEVDPGQHLRSVETGLDSALDVEGGLPVVHLEHRTGQATPVDRGKHQLVLQRPQQEEVLGDVGGGQQAVHAGSGQSGDQAAEQLGAAGHRGRTATRGDRAPGRMVTGDDHQPVAGGEERTS
jgi:hypothetical protein